MASPDRSIPTVFYNMCMVCDGDNVLVENRVDPKLHGYVFPGGHVENGESFSASVVREIFEETGLKIENPSLCGLVHWLGPDRKWVGYLYRADKFSGNLCSSDEGEVFWMPLDEFIKSPKLAPDMSSFLEIFLKDEYSELFYEEFDNNADFHLL